MPEKTVFQCPVCRQPLDRETTRYLCANGHSFDIAREGYVNLLLPRDTGRGKPGDTIPMLQSRAAFLQQGYYAPFAEQLYAVTATALQATPPPATLNLLDAGCGEGYYTWGLQQALAARLPETAVQLYGIDVAPPAIRYAAKRGTAIRFAVASSFHLPFLPESLDGITCLFAPRHEGEFARVLRPHGLLVVAAPGPRHLYQLRTLLCAQPEELGRKGTVTEGFDLQACIPVAFTIHLANNTDLRNLVTMTPYSRHLDNAAQARLAACEELTTEVDIHILVYRRSNNQ